MDVIYFLIPFVIVIGFLVVLVFFWSAKSGQLDDLDGAGAKLLMQDDHELPLSSPDRGESNVHQPPQ